MKKIIFVVSTVLINVSCLLSVIPVYSQSAQSDSLFAIGVDLYNEGKYQEAIPLFAKSDSLDKAELDSTSNRRNYSAMWLASCYYQQGDTILAENIDEYYRFKPIDRRLTCISDSLSKVGMELLSNGYYELALNIFIQCSELEKELIGNTHVWYGNSISICAYILGYLKRDDESINYTKEYIQIMEHNYGKYSKERLDAIKRLSQLYLTLKDYDRVSELLKKELEIIEKIHGKEHPDYATSLNNLASYLSEQGNHEEAVRLEEKALMIREKILGKEHPDYLFSLIKLSLYYSNLGNYTEAIKLGKETLKIYEILFGKEYGYALTLREMALWHSNLGNYTEAIRLGEEALSVLEQTQGNEHLDYVIALSRLCLYQSFMGNYTEAVRLGEKVLRITEQTIGKDNPYYASHLIFYSYSLFSMGNYEKAVSLGEKACTIYEKTTGKEDIGYATALSYFAKYHSGLGNYTEAIRYGKESLCILKKRLGKEHPYYIALLIDIASYQYKLGNYVETDKFAEEITSILEKKGKDNSLYASALNILSACKYELRNYTEAVKLEEQVIIILEKTLGKEHPHLATANRTISGLFFDMSKTDKVALYATTASEIVTNNIMRFFPYLNTSYRQKLWHKESGWFQSILCEYVYRFPTDSLTTLSYDGILLSKGLLLNSEIEIKRLIRESGNNGLQKIYDQMYRNKMMLQKLYEKPIQESFLNTDSLEHEIDKQESILMNKVKAYGDYTKNLRVYWKDVHQKLQDDDVSIEFVSFHLNTDSVMYMAFVLQKGMKIPKMIKLFEEKQLQENDKLNTTVNVSKLIWEPLANYLNGAKNVYFAPSGELYNIPIESLPHWSENCLMSDKWNMYRLSSTRELAVVKDKSKLRHAAVYGGVKYNTDTDMLVADSRKFKANERSFDVVPFNLSDSLNLRSGVAYLPATKVEAEEIDKTLEKKKITTMLRMDTLATEGDFKNLSGKRTNLLHIATHGLYWSEREARFRNDLDFLMLNDRRPQYVEDKALTRSGLLLAGANNALMGKKLPEGVDDGILTAKEISQLDLHGLDLVVLSACQTGLGEIKGDGVFGLQRGFKKAGANSIMMSLWKVDDEATRLLMTQFYKNLTSGMSKYESLKQAQKYVREYEVEVEVKSDEKKHLNANQNEQARKDATKVKEYKKIRKYEDPYYWAAFILLDALD